MYIEIPEIAQKKLIKGFKGRFVHTKNFTIAFWEIEAGAELPEHAHIHEQTTLVTEGELKLTVGEETRVCKPGTIVVIPSNIKHKGTALTDCKVTDTFYPVRQDYK